MIIDAHQHFWRLDRGDYDWLGPEQTSLYRDFLPEQIMPMLLDAGVHRTVLVQAAATEAETRYLLELARRYPFVAGVVGWVDFAAADVAARMDALLEEADGALKGFRPMIQDAADARWVANPSLDAAFQALAARGLTFDALVRPVHLQALEHRLERSPDVRVVIDHCAKPPIREREIEDWARALERIAAHPNTWCKLSGLLSEARAGDGKCELDPYVRRVFECFGAKRVMWGGDWPVLEAVSGYRAWFELARELVSAVAPDHHLDVFGANAGGFYGLSMQTPKLMLLSSSDNVAVARAPLQKGEAQWLDCGLIEPSQEVAAGFKVAARRIARDEKILKYGTAIGSALRDIAAGELVHVHNIKSDYLPTHLRGADDGDRS